MGLPALYAAAKADTAPQLAAQLRAENRRIFQTRYVGMPRYLEQTRIKAPTRSLSRADVGKCLPLVAVEKCEKRSASTGAPKRVASFVGTQIEPENVP